MWLYVCLHLFCHERDTHGTVSAHELNTVNAQTRKLLLIKRLVDVGLLEPLDDGWQIVKYDEKRPISALQTAKREDWAEQKRKQRAAMSEDMSTDKKPDSPQVRAEQSRAEQKREEEKKELSLSEPSTTSSEAW